MNQHTPQPKEHPQSAPTGTSAWAILAIIFAFIMPLLGIVFGIIALVEIKNNPALKGKGLAIAGIAIPPAVLLLIILAIVLVSKYGMVIN